MAMAMETLTNDMVRQQFTGFSVVSTAFVFKFFTSSISLDSPSVSVCRCCSVVEDEESLLPEVDVDIDAVEAAHLH